jgi:hypothetical protein
MKPYTKVDLGYLKLTCQLCRIAEVQSNNPATGAFYRQCGYVTYESALSGLPMPGHPGSVMFALCSGCDK